MFIQNKSGAATRNLILRLTEDVEDAKSEEAVKSQRVKRTRTSRRRSEAVDDDWENPREAAAEAVMSYIPPPISSRTRSARRRTIE